MPDEKMKDHDKLESLYSQVKFLKTIILICLVAGSCIVGLVFAHLWHDKQAFQRLNATVIEIKENVLSISDEIKETHPPKGD